MGRAKSEVSAVCPVCGTDFSGNGKDRYGTLKRHIRSQHPEMPDVMNITNNTVNFNVNIHTMLPMGMDDMRKMVHQIIEEVNANPEKVGNLCTFVFKTLHCNPKNPDAYVAAIPNVNKDEMIVLGDDGKAKVTTCKKGINNVLYRMFDSEVEEFGKMIGHDEFEPVLVQEAESGVCGSRAINVLKSEIAPGQRRDMVKRLKSRLE